MIPAIDSYDNPCSPYHPNPSGAQATEPTHDRGRGRRRNDIRLPWVVTTTMQPRPLRHEYSGVVIMTPPEPRGWLWARPPIRATGAAIDRAKALRVSLIRPTFLAFPIPSGTLVRKQ
jgi:hypothetical protein